MIDTIFFYIHHGLTLLSGVILSSSFCGIRFTKRNTLIVSSIFALCGISLLSTLFLTGHIEQQVWRLYPFVVHFPLIFSLVLMFKKRIVTAVSSVALAYLCCQPSKWFGLLFGAFILNSSIIWSIKIFVTVFVVIIIIRYFAVYISTIFDKDSLNILIFSAVPMIYYVLDYIVGVYTNLWITHYRLVTEFFAFFLCIAFMLFSVIYYKEYEKRIKAEQKEQLISVITQHQAKEIETIKKSNHETRLLRHDMRLILSNLALCIEHDDKQQALKTISGFASQVEAAALSRYCKNDTINYVLANFENRCREYNINFFATVEIHTLSADEILFSSILSNALDNALNAQKELPLEHRQIKLMLKNSGDKLLLSVKNPYKNIPVFMDGIPISSKKGHGYGTQSIRYMTEKLGGNYLFSIQDNMFVLQIIL